MQLYDFVWPAHLPCARETANVTVRARYGERLGWADPTAADRCGRDTPTACSATLQALLDGDGLLSCHDVACAWTFPASDLDAALVWLERPDIVGGLSGTMMCDEDPGTGVRWDWTRTPEIKDTVWRVSGASEAELGARAAPTITPDGRTVVTRVALAPPTRLADPESLPGTRLDWRPVKGAALAAAIADRDALSWPVRLNTPGCASQAWSARWPEGEGGLLRLEQGVGTDCASAAETRSWLMRTDGQGRAVQAVDQWTSRGGRQNHATEAVRLPNGRWGLRGDVVAHPDSNYRCERSGRFVMALTEPYKMLIADTTPTSCPTPGP